MIHLLGMGYPKMTLPQCREFAVISHGMDREERKLGGRSWISAGFPVLATVTLRRSGVHAPLFNFSGRALNS